MIEQQINMENKRGTNILIIVFERERENKNSQGKFLRVQRKQVLKTETSNEVSNQRLLAFCNSL